jgi:hypothetical protein
MERERNFGIFFLTFTPFHTHVSGMFILYWLKYYFGKEKEITLI